MSVTVKPLIDTKRAQTSATVEYSALVTAIIDKMTATNTTASAATVSVYLVPPGGLANDATLVVKAASIAAGATYKFPEVVGHTLKAGGSIRVAASAADSITIRASGREVS